ncbi:MAG: DNA polymerase, partial [Chloroflexota bacterium]|nr:DNA polymerase [Chloroflexota bacterium]
NGAVRNAAERMAINMPVQGTAADIMKIAMVKVHDRLRDAAWAEAVLQVHDELVFEVDRARIDELADLVRTEMAGAYALDVPLVVDIRSGDNWDEMTPLAQAAHA